MEKLWKIMVDIWWLITGVEVAHYQRCGGYYGTVDVVALSGRFGGIFFESCGSL